MWLPLTLQGSLLPYPVLKSVASGLIDISNDPAAANDVQAAVIVNPGDDDSAAFKLSSFSWQDKVFLLSEVDVINTLEGATKEDDFKNLMNLAVSSTKQLILTSTKHVNLVQLLEKHMTAVNLLKVPIMCVDQLIEKLPLQFTENAALHITIGVNKEQLSHAANQRLLQEAEERPIFFMTTRK